MYNPTPYYIWYGGNRSTAHEKIESLAKLPDGWLYGAGTAPSDDVRTRATRMLERLQMLGFSSVHVAAGEDGEILLGATSRQKYISITAEANGKYTFNFEVDRIEVDYAEGLDNQGVIERLQAAIVGSWITSGSFIQNGSIASGENSMTWLSKSPVTAECQFLKSNALPPQVPLYALT